MDQPGAVISMLMYQLGCWRDVLQATVLYHRWQCKASKAQPLQNNRVLLAPLLSCLQAVIRVFLPVFV